MLSHLRVKKSSSSIHMTIEVMIVIFVSIDEAWERFDRIYGKDRPVDYVKEVV